MDYFSLLRFFDELFDVIIDDPFLMQQKTSAKMAATSDAEFLKILEQAYEEAWEIVNSEDGWKKEAEEKGTLTNF